MRFRALKTMSRDDFRKHKLLQFIALRDIEAEEELLVDCSEKVMFLKLNNPYTLKESRTKSESSKYIAH